MDQMMVILTQNVGVITAAGLLAICIFQIAALHRIKKAEKKLDETGQNLLRSMDMLLKEREEMQNLLTVANQEQKGAEKTFETQVKESQEELIDKVLSEVFS